MKPGLKVALFLLLLPGLWMLLGSNMAAGLAYYGVTKVAAEEAVVPAFIEAVPTSLTAGVGEVQTVYVTVLDKDKKPAPNVLVKASSDTPNRASVEPEEVRTDASGKAVFTVKGVSYFSGSKAIITFQAGDVAATVETAQQWL